jgi:hypothetical protein
MAIGIFRKKYTLRKFEAQTVTDGYAASKYKDIIVKLNVQPQAPDNMDAQEQGDSTVKTLKSWGSDELTSADEYTNTPGDCLFYKGIWYECTSSVDWDHTLLAHFQSDFVNLPADKQMPPPPPVQQPKPPDPQEPPPESGVDE